MGYPSIDTLQKVLGETVFGHTKDSKKAAGRALGTFVELITYYWFRSHGFGDDLSIERFLPEYGNNEIKHKVEFLFYPVVSKINFLPDFKCPYTASKIAQTIGLPDRFTINKACGGLLSGRGILKNSFIVGEYEDEIAVADLCENGGVSVRTMKTQPYAMVECKRVGVEEGQKKGPQTIEKAKQGAYVAARVSSKQRVWDEFGKCYLVSFDGDRPKITPYNEFIDSLSEIPTELLGGFTLSIGIVSNHGNWFTSENMNKELKVLASNYDWLLFLIDNGLVSFINDLIIHPSEKYLSVREAFQLSYGENKGKENIFTKSRIDVVAHHAIMEYMLENRNIVDKWFNIISPERDDIKELFTQLQTLKSKMGGVV